MKYFNKLVDAMKRKRLCWFILNTIKYKKHIFFTKNPEIKRCIIEEGVYNKIKKDYPLLSVPCKKADNMEKSDKIWTCWLRGLENATELSYVCINRMIEMFGDRVTVISLENYKDYISLPNYIEEKFRKGYISYQHFADIIRNCLLVRYGGTWIDSTVYIINDNMPSYFFNSELFMFSHAGRNTKLEYLNYFITCYSNHPVLKNTQEFLFKLYKELNHEIDYLQMCMALGIAYESYSSDSKMPKYSDIQVHLLIELLNEEYDEKTFSIIQNICPIQKLSNKIDFVKNENTYYDRLILKRYKELKYE